MNVFSRRARRSVGVLLAMGLLLAACGGGDERSRNVETITGVACTKKGATKTVSKLNYVCGVGANGNVWFAVVGKLTTKGAKACKPLGKFDAATTRVCGSVKKKNVWVKVAPLPVAVSGVGETTVPATESTAVSSESSIVPVDSTVPTTPEVSSTTTPPATENAAGGLNEVARALAPAPQPETVEEFLALLVPRPVEAQAVRRVPTSIKVEGGAPTIANGSGFAVPLSVTVLDQNGEPLAAEGNAIVATISRPDATLTGAVATTDSKGSATFTNLRVDGVAGPAVITVTADFLASVEIPVEVAPGRAVKLSVQNHPTQIIASEKFSTDPTVVLLDKDGNQVRTAGVEVMATNEKSSLARVKTDAAGVATFAGLKIDVELARPEGLSTSIVYSMPSDPSIASRSVDVKLGPGSPNDLKVVTAPSPNARAGIPLEQQPVVRIVDAFGNPVAKKGVSVTAYFECRRFYCDSDESSQTVKTDKDGIARFTNLTLRGWTSSYNVAYVADDYDSGFSVGKRGGVVNVSFGEAAKISVFQKTSIFSSGINVESAFWLNLVDAWGNLISDYNGTLAVTANRDIGILTRGELKFQDGEVRVRNLTIKGTAGPLGITFQSGGFISDLIEVSVVAGTAAKFEILTPAGTITAGNKFENPLAVRLLDSDDNPIEVSNLQVAFSSSAGTASREIGLTNERGIASFVPAPIEKAGKVTLLYSDPAGKVETAQDVLTVVPATANSTRLVSASSVAEQSGVIFRSKPAVQLIDRFGNDVAQADITVTAKRVFGACSGARTVTNGEVKTNANGIALFEALSLKGSVCQLVIGFSPFRGVSGAELTVNLSAGPPAALGILLQPSGAVNGKAL
ncbi:MAG: hypothetical protein KJS66_10170, partial [Acidobacteria bacterium]|nr:hypothetical protein [Acidobacteriota bacterium]